MIFPTLGAVLGWIAYKVVIEGNTNLRDDFDAARRSASRRGEAETAVERPEPPADTH